MYDITCPGIKRGMPLLEFRHILCQICTKTRGMSYIATHTKNE